jgi:hypothetical protein
MRDQHTTFEIKERKRKFTFDTLRRAFIPLVRQAAKVLRKCHHAHDVSVIQLLCQRGSLQIFLHVLNVHRPRVGRDADFEHPCQVDLSSRHTVRLGYRSHYGLIENVGRHRSRVPATKYLSGSGQNGVMKSKTVFPTCAAKWTTFWGDRQSSQGCRERNKN